MRFSAFLAVAAICLAQAALPCQIVFTDRNASLAGAYPAAALEPSPDPDRIDVMAVGDVIPHQTVLDAAFDKNAGAYDFKPAFRHVKGYIQGADLAICNIETVFSGDGSYSGYPAFDSPDSLIADLRDTGFDVGIIANNHMLDQGVRGLEGTIDAMRRNSLAAAGAQKAGEQRYAMVTARGRKVAVIAYTFAGYDKSGRLVINTFPLPAEIAQRINYFTYRDLAAGLEQVRATVGAARAAGAEFVICYFHWGSEYDMAPDRVQIAMARAVSGYGADLILGSHPHIVQKVEVLKSGAGKDVPVFYSLGNFLSNQRLDTMDNRFAEDGMMAFASLEAAHDGRAAALISASAVATWVDKKEEGPIAFEIIPIDGGFRQNPTVASRNLIPKLEESLAATKNALGAVNFKEAAMRFLFYAPAEKSP